MTASPDTFRDRLLRRAFPRKWLPEILKHVRRNGTRLEYLEQRVRRLQEAVGRVEGRQLDQMNGREGRSLHDHEFRVYSQWGEDGIVRHLCQRVPVPRKVFVEFGVESYQEANTRFLMINQNWAGLVIDGDPQNVAHVRRSPEYWSYNLKAEQAFVTRENVNRLIAEQGIRGEIGLLSIDVDGMDFWLWQALEVISPAIVVVEYNHRFGPTAAVTVPYDAEFERRRAHHSLVYFGASLAALCRLAEAKGYACVGCGSAGVNAFFVRRDLKPDDLPALTAEDAFVPGRFCEAHDEAGERVKLSPREESELAQSLPLVTVDDPLAAPVSEESRR